MFPVAAVVWADAGDPVVVDPTTADGFDISGEGLSGRTAVIASGGDGANLRSGPGHDAEVLTTLADGVRVDLRIDELDTVYDPDGVTRWWPVGVRDTRGWVSGFFLADASAADDVDSDPSKGPVESTVTVPVQTSDQFEYQGEITASATAQVSGAGESVNVRAEPSETSELVATAADGQIVTLRIAAVDTVYDADGVTRWWPVTVDGTDGWISGFYLTSASATPVTATAVATVEPMLPDTTTSPFPVGSTVIVGTGDGFSVTLRAAGSPTAEVVGNLSDGQTVEILSGPVSFEGSETGWFEVTVEDLTGFVDGDLLTAAAERPVVTPEPTATAVSTTEPGAETPTATEPVDDDSGEIPTPDAAATTPAEVDDGETPAATTTVEAEEPTVTAIATDEVTPTEPDPEDENETPIPADTTDPDVTPETDPNGEDAAGSTGFIYPLENYRRTQGFGCSSLGFYPYDPDFGCAVHDGLDLAAPSGTPLLASADGEVVAAGWCDCGLGYYVEIDHGEGVHTVYGHMVGQPSVSTGQQVNQGDVIGAVGSTGISTGPHVHFMIRVNGVAQNPESYLP